MLETTLVSADLEMGTLSADMMIKMLPKEGCQENLMPHTIL